AAEKFGVTVETLEVAGGRIFSSSSGKSATYAELANEAAKLSPRSIALPPLAHGTYIGKGIPRADVPEKVRGVAQYGIDVREQGQLYAAIRHSPRIGGSAAAGQLAKRIARRARARAGQGLRCCCRVELFPGRHRAGQVSHKLGRQQGAEHL